MTGPMALLAFAADFLPLTLAALRLMILSAVCLAASWT